MQNTLDSQNLIAHQRLCCLQLRCFVSNFHIMNRQKLMLCQQHL